jgi:uncharacterized protein (DUF342 family)
MTEEIKNQEQQQKEAEMPEKQQEQALSPKTPEEGDQQSAEERGPEMKAESKSVAEAAEIGADSNEDASGQEPETAEADVLEEESGEGDKEEGGEEKPEKGEDSEEEEGEEKEGDDDEEDEEEEKKKEAEKGKDAEVGVEKSTDELRATIQIFPLVGKGSYVIKEIIYDALKTTKISYGIDEAAIEKAVENQEYLKPIQVALGTPPVDGQDAQIIYHYNRHRKEQDRSLQNIKRIDYKELNMIINVKEDDLLIEKIPATIGSEGKSVTGKVLRQTKGKDMKIRGSKGVRPSDDGLRYYAEIDGQVIFRNSEIKVEPIFETEVVDAKTGNVRFIGTVVVKSIVEDGYTIEASGDIRIGGAVGRSTIRATGDITIGGGVLGAGRCLVHSEQGNVYCKFVQDAEIIAGGDIFIEEYCKNSRLRAGGKVELTSDKPDRGFIMGGQTFAIEKIICNNVGSDVELHTELTAGVDGKMIEETARIRKDFEKNLQKIDNASKALRQLQRMRRKNKGLDKKRQSLWVGLLKTLIELRIKNTQDLEQFHDFLIRNRSEGKASVRVKQECHPDVLFIINGLQFETTTNFQNVMIKIKDGELQPLQM